MKQTNLLRASIGLCLLLCVCAIVVYASTAGQQNDPSVEPFWSKFKTAVQKTAPTSVASLSRFPIEMPYGVPKIRTRTQLARRWRDLFYV